jgi:tRNA threonylcarbamoyladenosine dehydratase
MLLQGNPDFVLDCIDDTSTKVDLLEYCYKNKIKVISSAGAGMRIDPTRLQIRDISQTSYDALAKSIREQLRKRGISKGIPVLFSNDLVTK